MNRHGRAGGEGVSRVRALHDAAAQSGVITGDDINSWNESGWGRSDLCHSAIDEQLNAVDVGAVGGCQEQDRLGDILRFRHSTERNQR